MNCTGYFQFSLPDPYLLTPYLFLWETKLYGLHYRSPLLLTSGWVRSVRGTQFCIGCSFIPLFKSTYTVSWFFLFCNYSFWVPVIPPSPCPFRSYARDSIIPCSFPYPAHRFINGSFIKFTILLFQCALSSC